MAPKKFNIIDQNNLSSLTKKLRKLLTRYTIEQRQSVIVGYTANYALHVHEMPMVNAGEERDFRKRIKSPTTKLKIRHHLNPRPRQVEPKGLFWDPQGRGQNKFLEEPFRTMQPEFKRIIRKTVGKSKGLKSVNLLTQGLLITGLRLQRESQKLVPVDLGNLKASAFTRKE